MKSVTYRVKRSLAVSRLNKKVSILSRLLLGNPTFYPSQAAIP